MKKIDMDEAKAWVFGAVTLHAHDLVKAFAQRFQTDKTTALAILDELALAGVITRGGSESRPEFAPASNLTLMHSYSLPLHGAERIWLQDFEPYLKQGLTESQFQLIHEGFDAVAENASHYSHGSTLHIIVERSLNNIELIFQDNGVGIFQKMSQTCPGFNTATGVLNAYITSHRNCSLNRLAPQFDYVQIEANGMCFPEQADQDSLEDMFAQGTTVLLALTLNHDIQ